MIALLAAAILIGVPIGFSLFFASAVVIFLDPGIDMLIMPIIAMEKLSSFTLLAIPLFMYAAMLLNEYEFTEDIVEISRILVGRFRGGLAHINVVASMFLRRGLRVVGGRHRRHRRHTDPGHDQKRLHPQLQRGHNRRLLHHRKHHTAQHHDGGLRSRGRDFGGRFVFGRHNAGPFGGALPDGGRPCLQHHLRLGRQGNQRGPQAESEEKLQVLAAKGFFPVSIFLIIIGGITGGVFTATEAAAVAAVYVIVVGPLLYKRARSFKSFWLAAKKAARLSAITYFAIIGASVFAWLLSYYRAIDLSISIFNYLNLGQTGFLMVLAVIYLILGTFLDPIPIIVIMTPLVLPLAAKLNIHPLLLGVISVMSIRIGTVTPPYGISMLVAAGIAKIDPLKMIKDISIFTALFMGIVVLIILFPAICLWIPSMAM